MILVGVSEQDGDDAEDSVAELAELVRTAGAVVVGTLIQKRELMHRAPMWEPEKWRRSRR